MFETTMPTTAETHRAAGAQMLLIFAATALLFTWGLQLPAVLAKWGVLDGPVERWVPLAGLGGFGPLVAALCCAHFEPGGAGIRGLFRRFLIWRVGVQWYAIALGLLPAIYVLGVAVCRLAGADATLPWFFPPETAAHVAALLIVPLVEEIGWRGYALPRLQQHYNPLVASIWVGVVWALYHLMMFVLQNLPPDAFAVGLADVFVGSILFSWIFNHTRGSLPIAVLAHASAHLNNPTHAIPDATPLAVQTVAITVLAGVLLFADRDAWRTPDQPRRA